jgi:hypothetical protein
VSDAREMSGLAANVASREMLPLYVVRVEVSRRIRNRLTSHCGDS